MIYSMTGFASAAAELDSGSLTLELRSVNHRYLDLQLRMPDELRTQEPALREARSCAYTEASCLVAPTARFDFGTGLVPESGRVALA